jgi:hypothetical protein
MASPPSCPGRHANEVVGPGTIDVDTCQAQPVCILVQRTRKGPRGLDAALVAVAPRRSEGCIFTTAPPFALGLGVMLFAIEGFVIPSYLEEWGENAAGPGSAVSRALPTAIWCRALPVLHQDQPITLRLFARSVARC